MDSNQVLNFATEGSKAITKINETIQKAFGHRWSRKQDKADAEADERRLKMIRDNPDMEIVFINGQMSARQRTLEELAQRAEWRQLSESIRQENNIESVLKITAEELKQVEDVSDEPVDEDWIVRFFNIIKDIGNAEMQFVWGKILADEIKAPGNFSLRTLDTIRNLSQHEAQTFQKIAPLVFLSEGGAYISANLNILQKYECFYNDILLLDECGLLVNNGVASTGVLLENGERRTYYIDNLMLQINPREKGQINMIMKVHFLTKAGMELLQILSFSPNNDYMLDFADDLYNRNSARITASIHRITGINSTSIEYNSDPEKEWKGI